MKRVKHMLVKEDVHGRIVRAIAEIDRYLCSKQDLSQYDIDDIFEEYTHVPATPLMIVQAHHSGAY